MVRWLTGVLVLALGALVLGCAGEENAPQRYDLGAAERALARAGLPTERVAPARTTPDRLPRPLEGARYESPGGTRFSILVYPSHRSATRARSALRSPRNAAASDNLLTVVRRPAGDEDDVLAVLRTLGGW